MCQQRRVIWPNIHGEWIGDVYSLAMRRWCMVLYIAITYKDQNINYPRGAI